MSEKKYFLVKDCNRNSHEMTVSYYYYIITAEEKEQYLKWFKESAKSWPNAKISYYNEDDAEVDSVSMAEIVKMLEEAKEINEMEKKTVQKLLPDVVKKYNEMPEYIERFTEIINEM